MARNEEKQLGRLNRLHLKKIHDDYEKKNPRRPKLEALNSTDDIRQWIPSIKKDIDFCLKQLQVPCYPERKIAEINVRITHLQGEYKAFVRKLREIDPKIKEIPWQDRPYQDRKRTSAYDLEKELKSQGKNPRLKVDKRNEDTCSTEDDNHSDFVPLATPVLDTVYSDMFGYHGDDLKPIIDVNKELQDKPLCFNNQGSDQVKGMVVQIDDHRCRQTEQVSDLKKATQSLNIPYSDSNSESDSSNQ